ncbi:MAG: ribonuclease R [Kiritimatiellales bacterium]
MTTTPALEERILAHLNHPKYQPLTRPDLAKALRLRSTERNKLRQALINLEKQGKVANLRKNRWAPAQPLPALTGTVHITDKGFAIFTADENRQEVYIAKDDLKTALDGDRVMVELLTPAGKRPARGGRVHEHQLPEGRVAEIIERRNTEVVGLLRRTPYYAYVIPDNLRLGQDIRVSGWKKGLADIPADHKVVIELNEWTDPFKPLSGTVIEDIGHRDDPNTEMQSILRAHGFRQNFPAEVIAEAERMPHELRPEEYTNRRDIRDRLTFTIDPATARDFDDAISLEKTAGGWKLSVHIADVAYFVQRNSALDKEALQRGNSIYLVDRVVMMLPPELTTRICSLNPNVDRLAHTVEISLTSSGEMTGADSFHSIIHSDARLNYDQVQLLFDGKPEHKIPAAVAGVLQQLRPLARTIRARRIENGSLEINTPQINFRLNAAGKVESIHKGEAKEAYQLIEECMLLANVAVARKLKDAGRAALHRIHEEPDEEQWAQMGAELQALGIDALPQSRAGINAVLEKIAGTPLEYTASLAVLRNLKRAGYSAEPTGHFGLAFEDYAHFTSPIRRYPDLVVHRLLSALEEKTKAPYGTDDLAAIGAQCTRTETAADAAEKESIDLRRVEYYNTLLYRGETGPYSGSVVRILNKGLIVELTDTLQRGLVPFASLTDDRYEVNRTKTKATGMRHRNVYTIGDALKVDIVRVDMARRLVDFRISGVEEHAPVRTAKGAPRAGRRKKQPITMTGQRPHGAKTRTRRKRK